MRYAHFLFVLLFAGSFSVHAQYNPQKIFVTNRFYEHPGNSYRSANGQPGPEYWQNRADYEVVASFDPHTRQLSGEVSIKYTNNSPDSLDMLWLQLDPNKAKSNSEYHQIFSPGKAADSTQGYHLKRVEIVKNGQRRAIPFKVYGTRMQIPLNFPVHPEEQISLIINYTYTLQKDGGRSGYMETKNGAIFQFSYWYPRMCVYDDYHGWNTLPFIGGGEMYLDYGTIDYRLRVPADQVVVGSGVLLNAEEILNQKTLKRIEKSRHSDQTVYIRKPDEIKEPVTRKEEGKVTWHFRMENTRDVAWAMSSAYIWDAAKADLKNGETVWVQSVYPIESTEEERGWPRATQMLKYSVAFFSDFVMPYPYQVATSVAGPVGGMEFPGLAFNHWEVKDLWMFILTTHEIGHTWFPMVVGSNERRYPFMDEGFNTFIDIYAQAHFNHGEFAPKRDGEYAPGGGNPADEIVQVIKENQNGPTIMTAADNMPYKYVHPLMYFKTAFGLVLLREVILGPDRFDYAFQHYAKTWAFKHPQPEDFFRSMANASGKDLTWFWQGWFYHNWLLDQAVKGVTYIEGDPKNGAKISVVNNRQMVMPILIEFEEENGKQHRLKIPVGIWKYGATATFKVDTHTPIKSITLDPDHQLPDANRENNVWAE